jgi:hypothetical protein
VKTVLGSGDPFTEGGTVAAILAYLDAGSGSMIVQLLLGGFAAIAVTVKLWWRRLLRFLRLRPKEPAESEPSPTAGD